MKFSIITICKDMNEYIRRTVDSVLNQNYMDYEYIIIDGDSKDGTTDILFSYKNVRMKIISEPDRGISDAFNKGVKRSSGEFLLFLNAGDYFINADVLEMAAKDIAIHKADIYTYSVSSLINPKYPESKKAGEEYWKNSLIPHQGTFIKKEVFEEIGLFNECFKVRMDYDFFCRCRIAKKTFYCNPIVITYYDSNGISSRDNYHFEKEGLAIRLLYYEDVNKSEKEIINFLIGSDSTEVVDYLETIENQKRLIVKNHKIMVLMYKWMQLINSGWNLEEYLLQNEYFKIAIYGFGLLGKILYTELIQKRIVVSYIIDQNENVSEEKIVSWGESWDSVDCIIVTPFYLYREIKERIKMEKGDFEILSLENILAEAERSQETNKENSQLEG